MSSLPGAILGPFVVFVYTGWPQVWVKKFKDFSRTFKYIFKTYFSDVLLRCGHIKSNRINFVFTQQVM